jgi:hypothetical protein
MSVSLCQCTIVQDKTGGKIIYRNINILILYRGRNYDPKQRPVIPLMLWKPLAPIYPKLVQNVAEGLTFEETKELRNRGLNSSPLMKLSKFDIFYHHLLNYEPTSPFHSHLVEILFR